MPRFNNRRNNKKRLPKVSKRIAQFVDRKLIQEEIKDQEVKQDLLIVAPAGAVNGSLTGVVFNASPYTLVGTSQGFRIGTKTMWRQISFKGTILSGTVNAAQSCRLILFRDMATNGIVPITSEILRDNAAGSAINSPMNQNNHKRFKVLYDKKFKLLPSGGSSNMQAYGFVNFKKRYVPGKGAIEQRNDDTTATAASSISGHLFGLLITDTNTTPPQIYYDSEVLYTDA